MAAIREPVRSSCAYLRALQIQLESTLSISAYDRSIIVMQLNELGTELFIAEGVTNDYETYRTKTVRSDEDQATHGVD